MVEQIGNQSFFPEVKADTRSGNKVSLMQQQSESYEDVLSKTLEKNNKPQKYKVDKPKVGNKEPFFPEKPMPYHPEENSVKKVDAKQATKIEASSTENIEEASKSDEAKAKEEIENLPELDAVDMEKLLRAYQLAQTGENQQNGDFMNQSFEKSSAIYPVGQIASESLDEDTKKLLMEQGLWNMQAQYVAQPTPKLLTMMEVVNNQNNQVSKPVAQFMASMQSELGIQPDRLAQAMMNLPEGQFSQSPEDTMKQVIKNLDLNKNDAQLATKLYSKMLNDMQKLDQSNSTLPETLSLVKPPQQEVQNQNVLGQNLEAKDTLQIKNLTQNEQKGFEQSFNQQSQNSMNMENKQDVKSDFKHSEMRGDLNTQHLHQVKPDALTAMGSSMAVNQGASMNNGAKQEAIQNIINNAQILSHKGGGEMKLTLRPDHLGEIQLKVSMNGSNVDIQMVAEKSETKKLIEQNISELKHGLAQHNLSMEKLDVSVSDKNTGNFNQGRQPDFNQAREFAQAFSQQQQGRAKQNEFGSQNQAFKHRSMLKQTGMSDLSMKRSGSSSGRLNVVA